MFANSLKIYDIFRLDLHLSDDKAMELVNELDTTICSHYDEKLSTLATKAELQLLEVRMENSIREIKETMATKAELKEVDNKVEQLKIQIEQTLVTKDAFVKEMKDLRAEIKSDFKEVFDKMDNMNNKMDGLNNNLNNKIDANYKDLNKFIKIIGVVKAVIILSGILGLLMAFKK
ncbi:hypothetical protein [Chitinophaga flava]|uniref:DUF1640 domain-containing protein n=1 Tax=Chitinophaga flava TaxID=2259036 RepID=A0A365XNQ2_9BACT|nr:hypothetical protein [Chitinophaga flava]RBL87973.1 hypothetical protein DF182_31035 [Chitinophaga flava]